MPEFLSEKTPLVKQNLPEDIEKILSDLISRIGILCYTLRRFDQIATAKQKKPFEEDLLQLRLSSMAKLLEWVNERKFDSGLNKIRKPKHLKEKYAKISFGRTEVAVRDILRHRKYWYTYNK